MDRAALGNARPLTFADSDDVRVGDDVVAVGHPFGLDRTATSGIVSGLGREIQAPNGFQIDEVIQTDAAINPGNSGGPLVDARGRVIGVNSQIATAGAGGNVGVGFAVPSNTVRQVLPRLSRGQSIDRAYLGVTTSAAAGGAAVEAVVSGEAGRPRRAAAGERRDRGHRGKDCSRTGRCGPGDREPQAGRQGDRDDRARRRPARRRGDPGEAPVSFQAPLFLLGLVLVPLVVFLYARNDRSRRAAAGAFVTSHMLPSVAPATPGWRRHALALFYGAALAVLAVALARPEATVAVPEERASVVLATDQSGSMDARDVPPSRLEAARSAAGDFLDDVPGELRVGAVAFNHTVRAIEAPSTDRAEVRRTIDGLRSSGGTATGEGLAASLRLLERRERGRRRVPPSAIVLLSDGKSTHGRDPLPVAREAARLRIPIYTVAWGTDGGTISVQTPAGPGSDAYRPTARHCAGWRACRAASTSRPWTSSS